MKKKSIVSLFVACGLFAAFALWTFLVKTFDVRAIGPRESEVGFAGMNAFVHRLTGVNMTLYTVTDWLGLVPVAFCLGFAVLGLVQWIKRRNILRVDYSLLVLGGYYVLTIAMYVLFEEVVINYRPVLIEGYLEASYPSSTTLLVLCVMPTAIMQLGERIKYIAWRRAINGIIAAFTAFMVIGRFVSGVHWASDIIGGILVSAGLVTLYSAVVCLRQK